MHFRLSTSVIQRHSGFEVHMKHRGSLHWQLDGTVTCTFDQLQKEVLLAVVVGVLLQEPKRYKSWEHSNIDVTGATCHVHKANIINGSFSPFALPRGECMRACVQMCACSQCMTSC